MCYFPTEPHAFYGNRKGQVNTVWGRTQPLLCLERENKKRSDGLLQGAGWRFSQTVKKDFSGVKFCDGECVLFLSFFLCVCVHKGVSGCRYFSFFLYRSGGEWCRGAGEGDHLLDGQAEFESVQRVADANLPLNLCVWQSWHDGSTLHVGTTGCNIPGWHTHPQLVRIINIFNVTTNVAIKGQVEEGECRSGSYGQSGIWYHHIPLL